MNDSVLSKLGKALEQTKGAYGWAGSTEDRLNPRYAVALADALGYLDTAQRLLSYIRNGLVNDEESAALEITE